jgi:hypothetical protein
MERWLLIAMTGAYLLRTYCEPPAEFARHGSLRKAALGALLVVWVIIVAATINGG